MKDDRGFTLIELSLVVVLLVLMSAIAATRFGIIDTWQRKTSIRSFINTWEFIASQARFRGESYRLVIDIDRGTYYVRREIPVEGPTARNVDYLRGFRTQSELERRAKEETRNLQTLEEEYKEEDIREGDALENIFYRAMFRDPNANYRLGVPIEFPSLKDEIRLIQGLRFRDVSIRGEENESGIVAIRFTSTGATDFAVIHLASEGGVMTAVMNPATRKVNLIPDDVDYSWAGKSPN